MPEKHRLQILREEVGLTRSELAELAELAWQTIPIIENGTSPYKTHQTVAERLAAALYVKVSDIFHASELSHLGRPAGTGTPIAAASVYRCTETFTVKITCNHVECPHCHMVVPPRDVCIQCERPLMP